MRLKRLAQGDMKTNGKYDDTYWAKGIRLPNCTLYSLLRLWEQGMAEQALFTYTNSTKAFPNAKLWWNYWKGKKGSIPKQSCVLVWGGDNAKYGHVAICEDVISKNSDGSYTVQVSQSNYGGNYFEFKTYTIKQGVKTTGVGLTFLGCLYVDIDLGQAERNKKKHQAQIDGTAVYSRSSANGNKISGMYTPMGYYNVIAEKDINGTVWIKVGTSDGTEVWCGAYTDLPATEEEVDLNSLIVDRDTTKHQIEVIVDDLRARSSATKNKDNIIGYIPKGIFNVYDSKEADDLTWYRVGTNVWIALVKDCYKDYKAEDSYEKLYKEEVAKYEELEKKYNSLNSKYTELETDYKELNTKVSSLETKISNAKEALA